jgi:hypothetical protein
MKLLGNTSPQPPLCCSAVLRLALQLEGEPEEIVTTQHYNQPHKKTKNVNREAQSSLFSTSFVTKQHYN